MAKILVALGSNKGDRLAYLREAKNFLASLAENVINYSSIYKTEPVGPSKRDFFNAVVSLEMNQQPQTLLKKFKEFEKEHGRTIETSSWEARTIDLDIISYEKLVIQTDSLIIPHAEYHKRLFVLIPLQEIEPEWKDPETERDIADLIEQAPALRFHKTDLRW